MYPIRLQPHIAQALRENRPVVALESSVIAQGLPQPANREVTERMIAAVESGGAVPAITAVVHGTPALGLESDELERFFQREGIRKVSARDLPGAMAAKADGATTVAASLCLAQLAGVDVFATGGIGGVHRGAPFDESADLMELSRTPMIVVCAGAKSILDLNATSERLESLGIPVVGYRTDELPGFITAKTGIKLQSTAESAAEVAAIYRAHRSLGRTQSVVVVQPPPLEYAVPQEKVEAAVAEALREAEANGVRGAGVTPYLLNAVSQTTEGASLSANLALLESNASLAAEIATAWSAERQRAGQPR